MIHDIRYQIALIIGLVFGVSELCRAQTTSRPVAISAKVMVSNDGNSKLLSPEEATAKAKNLLLVPAVDEIKDDTARSKARKNWSAIAQVFVDYIPQLPKTLLTEDGLQWYIESANAMLQRQVEQLAALDDPEAMVKDLRVKLHKYAALFPDRSVTAEQRHRRADNFVAFHREAALVLRSVVEQRGIAPPEKQDEVLKAISEYCEAGEKDARHAANSIFFAKTMAVFDKNPFVEKNIRDYYESALPPGPLFYMIIRAEISSLIKAARATVVDYTPYGEPSAAEMAKQIRAGIEKIKPPPPEARFFAATQATAIQATTTRPAR